MFGFGKKRLAVAAPLRGKILDITEVPDATFAEKLLGDGFAVEPEQDEVVKAPMEGKIILVAESLHAIAIENHGVELLIHIGLDTVDLNGKGFCPYVKLGDFVKQGTPLIQFDTEYIRSQEKSLMTMVVLTNADKKIKIERKSLADAEQVLTILTNS